MSEAKTQDNKAGKAARRGAKATQGRRKGSGKKGPCPDTSTVTLAGTAMKAASDRVGVPPDSLLRDPTLVAVLAASPKVARALVRVREALAKDPHGGGLWSMQLPRASSGVENVRPGDLELLRKAGIWDGTVSMSLPGVTFQVRSDSLEARSKSARFAPEEAEYLVGAERRPATDAERSAIVRAVTMETLGNINPHASESREFAEQVLSAAFTLARTEHLDPDVSLEDPAAEEIFKDHLRELLAGEVPGFGVLTPEQALFLAAARTDAQLPRYGAWQGDGWGDDTTHEWGERLAAFNEHRSAELSDVLAGVAAATAAGNRTRIAGKYREETQEPRRAAEDAVTRAKGALPELRGGAEAARGIQSRLEGLESTINAHILYGEPLVTGGGDVVRELAGEAARMGREKISSALRAIGRAEGVEAGLSGLRGASEFAAGAAISALDRYASSSDPYGSEVGGRSPWRPARYASSSDPYGSEVSRRATRLRYMVMDATKEEAEYGRRLEAAKERYLESLSLLDDSLDDLHTQSGRERASRLARQTQSAYVDVESTAQDLQDAVRRSADFAEHVAATLESFAAPAGDVALSVPELPRSSEEYAAALAATGLQERLRESAVLPGGVGMRPGEHASDAWHWGNGVYNPSPTGPGGTDALSWAREQLAAAELAAPGVSIHTALHDDGPAALAALTMVATREDLASVSQHARSEEVRRAAEERLSAAQSARAELTRLCGTMAQSPALITSSWHAAKLASAAAAVAGEASGGTSGGDMAAALQREATRTLADPSGALPPPAQARERLLLLVTGAARGSSVAAAHDPDKLALELLGLASMTHRRAGFGEFISDRYDGAQASDVKRWYT